MVQLHQCGVRTTQCTIQGTLDTPQHHKEKIQSLWERRFGEKADPDFIHILQVERVLQIDNFMEVPSVHFLIYSHVCMYVCVFE